MPRCLSKRGSRKPDEKLVILSYSNSQNLSRARLFVKKWIGGSLMRNWQWSFLPQIELPLSTHLTILIIPRKNYILSTGPWAWGDLRYSWVVFSPRPTSQDEVRNHLKFVHWMQGEKIGDTLLGANLRCSCPTGVSTDDKLRYQTSQTFNQVEKIQETVETEAGGVFSPLGSFPLMAVVASGRHTLSTTHLPPPN